MDSTISAITDAFKPIPGFKFASRRSANHQDIIAVFIDDAPELGTLSAVHVLPTAKGEAMDTRIANALKCLAGNTPNRAVKEAALAKYKEFANHN